MISADRRREPGLRLSVLWALCGVLALVAACSAQVDGAATEEPLDADVPSTLTVDVSETGTGAGNDVDGSSDLQAPPDRVPELLASLTVQEKIGQLLMPTFMGRGDSISDAEAQANLRAHGARTPSEIVELHHLGGVIYLPDNIESAAQVSALSDSLQAAAAIPLLVSVDQEGGRVSRLTDEVSDVPSASDLAGSTDEIRQSSYATGQQVRQQGVNVVLAPVADVVSPSSPTFISDRSYGSDPRVVAESVGAAVDGLQKSGVAAAVKHWPGHGATSVDSHQRLPTLDIDRQTWESRELVPFLEAFDQNVAVVLVGHLAIPQLDPQNLPATVSPAIIDGLLRSAYGYDGVVMTDALNMGAVANYDEGELVVASVQAGMDVILMPPSLIAARAALEQAIAEGSITEERLDESVARILELKQRLGLLDELP